MLCITLLNQNHQINYRMKEASSCLMPWSSLTHAILFLVLLSTLSLTSWHAEALNTQLASNETDRMALLSFKSALSDPLGVLSSWNDSVHYCQWTGVSCSRRHPERVTALILTHLQLAGPISPALANLSFLQMLVINQNELQGHIPHELFRMPRLSLLVLSANYLDGEIPASFTNSTSLRQVGFTNNQLTGEIPKDIGSLSKLQTLNMGMNSLTGSIPASIGNMSSLYGLTMQQNYLEGSLPESLGKLTELTRIQAYNNSLSGSLPSSMFNLSNLRIISMASNMLGGSLSSNMFNTLPNLQYLLLSENQFHGAIPASLSNASDIQDLEMASNGFSGTIPSALGGLQYLWWLELSYNQLEAKQDRDWDFISSLANCSALLFLGMQNNALGGTLPISIANLSPGLNYLVMGLNQISGAIPAGMANLVNLTVLHLNDNNLTGIIPNTIGRLPNLHELILSGNSLTGEIPSTIGNLTQLTKLHLQRNDLNGSIPASLGSCGSLQELDLSQNKLTGSIPREVFMLASLSMQLDLSSNLLTGPLPAEVSKLKNLGRFAVSDNRLSDAIPSSLGDCQSLEYLYMQGNFFKGTIPASLSNLKGLQVLDLSRNNLSGEIPESLQTLRSLQQMNLSFNNLEGEVPKGGVFANASALSVTGNKNLCGGDQKLRLPTCNAQLTSRKKHKSLAIKVILPVLSVVLIIILAIILSSALHRLKNLRKGVSFKSPTDDPFSKVSYAELLRATDGFSASNLIGTGSFGFVYKCRLDSCEGIVAVKVLNLQRSGAEKTFTAECETLRHIRHRNLVKIITSCSSTDFQGNDFKALVLKYMPNGSLENWLHPGASEHSETMISLTLSQRLNIAVDVASALDYLHHQGHVPIVHCDLKPSNVLLDEDMHAHVSDFGLSRFLCIDSKSDEPSRSIAIKGTVGYVAPEYGMGVQASTHGDVYSYGILLLELLTGKRPTDDMFKDGISLRTYVEMACPTGVFNIVDPSLLSLEDDGEVESNTQNIINSREKLLECLVSATRIGLSCTKEDPKERLAMEDATKEMHAVREAYYKHFEHKDDATRS